MPRLSETLRDGPPYGESDGGRREVPGVREQSGRSRIQQRVCEDVQEELIELTTIRHVGPGYCHMEVDLANAMIAAALIQSGQFKLSDYDERGQPIRGRQGNQPGDPERLMRQAQTLGDPDFDSFGSPALTTLRKLTNAIRRALYEGPASLPRP
jgi:hypothetical protein